MNQMTSGVYCSAERVACLWTNMEVSNVHVGGMEEAYFKWSSVTLFWLLPNLRPNLPYFFLPQIPCFWSCHIFSTFPFLHLFNFVNISFLSLARGQNGQRRNLLSIHKINSSHSPVHWLPCSKFLFHHTKMNKISTFVSLLVWRFDQLSSFLHLMLYNMYSWDSVTETTR